MTDLLEFGVTFAPDRGGLCSPPAVSSPLKLAARDVAAAHGAFPGSRHVQN